MPENENMPDSTTPDTAAPNPETPQTSTKTTTDSPQPDRQAAPEPATPGAEPTGKTSGAQDAAHKPSDQPQKAERAEKAAKAVKPKASRPTHPEPVHSTSDRSETLRRVDGREMRLAVGNSPFPVEQTEAWERFEEAITKIGRASCRERV